MLFLLDANVLIDANRDYYAITRVPEFWEWLIYHGEQGNVKIPIEVYEELTDGDDDLADWARGSEVKNALLLKEAVEVILVQRILRDGYAPDLNDTEVAQLGRDPFFIAYAINQPQANQRCIVTTESSKPSKIRANRHIPDVCGTFGIPWCNSYEFFKTLGFSTYWKEQSGIRF
jgi:hypothetical protein